MFNEFVAVDLCLKNSVTIPPWKDLCDNIDTNGFKKLIQIYYSLNCSNTYVERHSLKLAMTNLQIHCSDKAEMIYGIDIDHDCLEIAQNNFNDLNVPTEFIQMDIGDSSFNSKFRSNVNPIVIMNPPFGTKVKGIDLLFLKFAADLNPKSIYSLHKSTTTKHLIKKAVQYNLTGNVLAKLNYDLYSTFNFHKSKCVNIDVDFIKWNLN
ncbi:Methyltransferase-like protein 5 [Intoshia linei]|uniref:Methyltransferase-like protein 5 n=1 Tax=Intoshia linei TaxID=1819745 RepID=A0A177BDB1_9BILA|nr:Methyltransferase-like protein 5 [Intoshia linei]